MIANIVTVSRILFSICLLVLPPFSVLFAVLYLLCGVTDVLDGFIARKLHTESKAGEQLDSAADLFFAFAYAVRIIPLLHLPFWVWIITALIAAVKIRNIILTSKAEKRLSIQHSFANKITGLLIFLLPLSVHFFDIKYGAAVVCAAAACAAFPSSDAVRHRV